MAKKNTADVVFLVGLLVVLVGLFVYINTLPPEPEEPEEGEEGVGETDVETGSVVSISDHIGSFGSVPAYDGTFDTILSDAGSGGGTA